jgi:hypothetical protein
MDVLTISKQSIQETPDGHISYYNKVHQLTFPEQCKYPGIASASLHWIEKNDIIEYFKKIFQDLNFTSETLPPTVKQEMTQSEEIVHGNPQEFKGKSSLAGVVAGRATIQQPRLIGGYQADGAGFNSRAPPMDIPTPDEPVTPTASDPTSKNENGLFAYYNKGSLHWIEQPTRPIELIQNSRDRQLKGIYSFCEVDTFCKPIPSNIRIFQAEGQPIDIHHWPKASIIQYSLEKIAII